ncbi:MAG: hypothetical protein Tsb0021_13460 [Chlamydiales bacterium]
MVITSGIVIYPLGKLIALIGDICYHILNMDLGKSNRSHALKRFAVDRNVARAQKLLDQHLHTNEDVFSSLEELVDKIINDFNEKSEINEYIYEADEKAILLIQLLLNDSYSDLNKGYDRIQAMIDRLPQGLPWVSELLTKSIIILEVEEENENIVTTIHENIEKIEPLIQSVLNEDTVDTEKLIEKSNFELDEFLCALEALLQFLKENIERVDHDEGVEKIDLLVRNILLNHFDPKIVGDRILKMRKNLPAEMMLERNKLFIALQACRNFELEEALFKEKLKNLEELLQSALSYNLEKTSQILDSIVFRNDEVLDVLEELVVQINHDYEEDQSDQFHAFKLTANQDYNKVREEMFNLLLNHLDLRKEKDPRISEIRTKLNIRAHHIKTLLRKESRMWENEEGDTFHSIL